MSTIRRVAITGASTGLGAALARALSAPGASLHLCARRIDGLEATARDCRERGAVVSCESVDLRDPVACTDWVDRIGAVGPIDMLVLNAGVFAGRPATGAMEPVEAIPDLVATNLTAAILCATRAVPAMRAHGQSRIVLVSSLAGVSPLPDAPAYSAAKAGLSAFGKALGDDLAGSGVSVHVVEPGHIHTHQADQQEGTLPFAVSPEAAAARILRGVARGKARIAFPLLVRLYVQATDLAPRPIRLLLNRSHRFTVRNDPPSPR
jgi:short-subunit dehydrogenase